MRYTRRWSKVDRYNAIRVYQPSMFLLFVMDNKYRIPNFTIYGKLSLVKEIE